MKFNTVNRKLRNAIKKVLKDDRYLLVHSIREPSVSHRLALYLEPRFPDFDVDCEYDGNIDSERRRKQLYLATNNGNIDLKDVIPDIIIHKRGKNGKRNNLLVIEIKLSSNSSNGDMDAQKLSGFTSNEDGNNFSYKFGVFIRFIVGKNPYFSIEWYQNGQKLELNS
jgi:hypothetical protein